MSIDLCRENGEEFRCSTVTWIKALELAQAYGWQPQGTVKPRHWDDPGSEYYSPEPYNGEIYWTNDGQGVTHEDARESADALERSLQDIPDETGASLASSQHKTYRTKDDWIGHPHKGLFPPGVGIKGENHTLGPIDFFSGMAKRMIRGVIEFCRRGSFAIW